MKKQGRRAVGGERGAVAIIVAMASAAIGVDLARLVQARQGLQNSLDAAAAAGVLKLPDDPSAAIAEAEKFANANAAAAGLGSVDLSVALRCVTSYNSTTDSPDWATVLAVCGISSHTFDPFDCNESTGICSVACTTSDSCNTIVVKASEEVDYSFGPAIGFPTGNTGSIVSAACRGYCGTVSPNPLDVVVMADRTPSMADGFTTTDTWTSVKYETPSDSLSSMKEGIQDMLGAMTEELQYVAFGTIALSWPTSTNLVAEPSGGEAFEDAVYKCSTTITENCTSTWSSTGKKWTFEGSWVPVGFTNDYTQTDSSGVTSIDTSSTLGKAVGQLEISDSKVTYPSASSGSLASSNEGTHLAAALKGAARYLLNTDPVADAGLPERPEEYGTPKKVIIFETDGSPSEVFSSDSSAVSLSNSLDIGAAGNGKKDSCDNFSKIATEAKANDIRLIMIGVGAVNKATCGTSSTSYSYVRDVMAAAASPTASGAASTAIDCTVSGNTEIENSDGDNYYCASSSADLKSVFISAFGSLTENSKLMSLPNMGTWS